MKLALRYVFVQIMDIQHWKYYLADVEFLADDTVRDIELDKNSQTDEPKDNILESSAPLEGIG